MTPMPEAPESVKRNTPAPGEAGVLRGAALSSPRTSSTDKQEWDIPLPRDSWGSPWDMSREGDRAGGLASWPEPTLDVWRFFCIYMDERSSLQKNP